MKKTPAEELAYLVPVLREMNAHDLDSAHGGVCAIAAKVLTDQEAELSTLKGEHAKLTERWEALKAWSRGWSYVSEFSESVGATIACDEKWKNKMAELEAQR